METIAPAPMTTLKSSAESNSPLATDIHTAPTKEQRSSPTELNLHKPVLKVLGLGGGGNNAVNRMIELGLAGVEYIAANTDRQVLKTSLAPVKIQLGPRLTRGLGAGGTPSTGQSAAEESFREIAAALHGADMVFLTAGMGGGTGTGSIPVAAKISRALGAVTIAIVTTPFSFERGVRQRNASEGLAKLSPNTDTLITIPNDRLLQLAPRNLPLEVAFRMADDVLRQAVQGITELITEPGIINVDFAHVRNMMKLGGGALMSLGQGMGENKALKAVDQALHHPLLEDVSIENAKGILVNFTAGEDLTLFEIEAALSYLQKQAGAQAEIVMGVADDERMTDRVLATLIITGLGAPTLEETLTGLNANGVRQPLPQTQSQPRSNSYVCSSVTLPTLRMAHPVEITAACERSSPKPPSMKELRPSVISSPGKLDLPAFLRRPR